VHDALVSFLKFLFDSDYRQRADIEELREMQFRMALSSGGGASEKWVEEIADEVKELAAAVRVLMRIMSEAGMLDVARVRELVAEELAPKKQAKAPPPMKPPKIEPVHPVTCTRCKAEGLSIDFVSVGSDWLCRPCARNP
jgi:hypothetical protein